MYTKTRLHFILFLFSSLLLTGCVAENTDPDAITAEEICSQGNGLPYGDYSAHVPIFYGQSSALNARIIFEYDQIMPECDVLQAGMLYTTDGSEPTLESDNTINYITTNQDIIKVNPHTIFTTSIYYTNESGKMVDAASSADAVYVSNLKAVSVSRKQEFENLLSNISNEPQSNISYTLFVHYALDLPQPPPGARVRFYLRSLKSGKIAYTVIINLLAEEVANTPPPAEVDQDITPTIEPLVYNVSAQIKNPKALSGYMYTTSEDDFMQLLEHNDASGPGWSKVFLTDSDLTNEGNNTYSFNEEVTLENGVTYYISTFTSEDTVLDPDKTTFSIPTPVTPNTGEPALSITASASGINITASAELIDNGGTAITAYGFNLYNSANPDAVIDSKLFNGVPGNFTHSFNSLPNGSYIVKAYATNNNGITGYATQTVIINGNLVVTIDVPTSDDGFTWIANFKGHVPNTGSSPITNYGFEYTHPVNIFNPAEPTTEIANSANVDGDLNNFTFSKDSISLYPGLHKIKAFATNANGTTYSTEKTFTVD